MIGASVLFKFVGHDVLQFLFTAITCGASFLHGSAMLGVGEGVACAVLAPSVAGDYREMILWILQLDWLLAIKEAYFGEILSHESLFLTGTVLTHAHFILGIK